MLIKKFEDVIAWRLARQLSLEIYKNFRACRDYSFRDQIQRASISVMNNIAEGFDRQSNKEFIRFLYIAKGLASEVRSMLYIAKDLNYIDYNNYRKNYDLSMNISGCVFALIKSIQIK